MRDSVAGRCRPLTTVMHHSTCLPLTTVMHHSTCLPLTTVMHHSTCLRMGGTVFQNCMHLSPQGSHKVSRLYLPNEGSLAGPKPSMRLVRTLNQ